MRLVKPAKFADMDADFSALLASAGKDDDNMGMLGDNLLKELVHNLMVSVKMLALSWNDVPLNVKNFPSLSEMS